MEVEEEEPLYKCPGSSSHHTLLVRIIIPSGSLSNMRSLVALLLAGYCLAQPLNMGVITVAGDPYTVYSFPGGLNPAVVRIDSPGIKLNLPEYPKVYTSVNSAVSLPVVKATAPVHPVSVKAATPLTVAAAPAPTVKAVAKVTVASAPVTVVKPAAPVTLAAAPVPVVKSASPVAVAIAPEPLQAPQPPMPSVGGPFVGGTFHAQDEAGQYSFGHWGGPNTRVEMRDSLGRTTGSFAYVDPEGEVQMRKYAAAPLSGFKVAASDLPVDSNIVVQDTPEVAQVKAAHARAFEAAKSIISHATISA